MLEEVNFSKIIFKTLRGLSRGIQPPSWGSGASWKTVSVKRPEIEVPKPKH